MRRQDRNRADRLSARTRADPVSRSELLARWQHQTETEGAGLIPVHLPIVGHVWIAITHGAAAAVLKDARRFTVRRQPGGRVAGLSWWMPKTLRILTHSMLTQDDPDHGRLRGMVDRVFARQGILALEPRVEAIARHLLETVSETGANDLVSSYTRPLPLLVICELLGISQDERDAFAKDAEFLSRITSVTSFARALWPLRRLRLRVENMIARAMDPIRSGSNGEDVQNKQNQGLLHGLVAEHMRQQDGPEPFSRDELVSMVFLLLVAGHETTTHALAGSIALLAAQNKGQLSALDGSPLQVEECLRSVSAVEFSKARFCQTNGRFFGAEVEAGDLVMASLAAANHDPTKFDDPMAFDPERRPNPHIQFGAGSHFCLGHQLARLEIAVGLRVLGKTFPHGLIDAKAIIRRPRLGMAVIERLPMQRGQRVKASSKADTKKGPTAP
ncbi:MAG: cytochrome P450 [Pseudomonadota bacterium]